MLKAYTLRRKGQRIAHEGHLGKTAGRQLPGGEGATQVTVPGPQDDAAQPHQPEGGGARGVEPPRQLSQVVRERDDECLRGGRGGGAPLNWLIPDQFWANSCRVLGTSYTNWLLDRSGAGKRGVGCTTFLPGSPPIFAEEPRGEYG